jgi:hypothetical protein
MIRHAKGAAVCVLQAAGFLAFMGATSWLVLVFSAAAGAL